MFMLTRRECELGSNVNIRTQFHGDAHVTALDIPIKGVALTDEELNKLLLNESAWHYLYESVPAPAVPSMPLLAPLQLAETIDGANVQLFIGPKPHEVRLTGVKLKDLSIELKTGGVSLLAFKVQCTPNFGRELNELLMHLSGKAELTVDVEQYGAQQPLELGEAPPDTKDNDEGAPPARGRGRRRKAPVDAPVSGHDGQGDGAEASAGQ